MNAGKIRNFAALAYSTQKERENNLSFTLNSHVCAKIPQCALRKNAVTGPAKDNRSLGEAPAICHHLPDRREQELGPQHVLVIDVSYRNTDDLGAENLEGASEGQLRVALEHQIQQDHLVASVSCCGRHTGESQWQSGHAYRLGIGGDQQNSHCFLDGLRCYHDFAGGEGAARVMAQDRL
jgi:hypothetical protein